MPEITYTALDLITDAFIEIGATAPGEQPSSDEAQWGLRKLNDLLDTIQALAAWVYGYSWIQYNLVPGLQPHTIGPADGGGVLPVPTFSTGDDPRPVRIAGAAQLQQPGTSTQVRFPINCNHDKDWYQNLLTNLIDTNVVTDLYYDPTSPLGSIYFWPVPNTAAVVELQLWQTVQQFESIQDAIGGPGGAGIWPQGYRNAIKLTLAEMLLPGSQREEHPTLASAAMKARAAVLGNNAKSPRMRTADSGMPKAGRSGVRGDFNWTTGGAPGGRPE
jgi:hypothetical protein